MLVFIWIFMMRHAVMRVGGKVIHIIKVVGAVAFVSYIGWYTYGVKG